jgi:CRP-like cAMP-binding protein
LTLPPALKNIPLFKDLSEAQVEAVYRAAKTRQVAQGGFFFYQEDPAEAVYILSEGRVKLTQLSPDGQQVLVRVITPWTLFGAVAMTPEASYPVSAQADQDSRALSWSKSSLQAFIGQYPQLALNAMQMMAAHVKEFQDRYRELATERVERRLARAILRLASQTGRKIPEGILLDLPLTRQDLAEMSATTLYTVSRILSQWEERGLVEAGRERLVLRKPHGLVVIAEDLLPPDPESQS